MTATSTAVQCDGEPLLPGLFDAVLFDLDGTLVDSSASVQRCWLTWAAEYDVEPQRLLGWHGVPARQIIDALLGPEQAAAALARIEQLEVDDVEGILALPGAVEALQSVGTRGAIATSCTRPLGEARIAASGLPRPAVVVTASDVRAGKPDPEPFLTAAARLGVDPTRCLVVEDAPAGLTGARAAGCATLAVVSTHRADELDADVVVPDLSHVQFVTGADGVQVLRRVGGGTGRR